MSVKLALEQAAKEQKMKCASEREGGREGGGEREREREREREKETLKTLFSKDCSLGSFRPV